MTQPRILVVDDDPDVLEAVRLALAHMPDGPAPLVDVASSGAEALRRVQETRYALVLADYRMPGMDGIQLLARVRDTSPSTVRGLFTGFHDLDIALAAVEQASIHYYLQKPWELAELRSVVREALERP